MSQKVLTIICSFMALVVISMTPRFVHANDDWETWNAYVFKFKITDNLKFIIEPKNQIRDDMSDSYYWESVQGFSYKLNKNVDLGLFHLYAEKDRTTVDDSEENRIRSQITLKTKWKNFKISDRNRYEYRMIASKPKSRYRNRISVSHSLEIGNLEFTPYVSNEFFYDFRDNRYNQNRAAIGIKKKIIDRVTLGIYYMYVASKSSDNWSGHNTLGSSLSIDVW